MFNFNSGYGRGVFDAAHSLAEVAPNGKVFVVGASTVANKGIVEQIFKSFSGDVRVHADIDSAVNEMTASSGDVMLVLPGHTETISTATSINLDVAGITIIGLGYGSDRPTITFDTATTTTIPVSAANITIKNMIFTANFADIVAVFTLAAAKDFRLENCYIKATATNMNFLYVVDTGTTTSAVDGLTLIGNKWIEPDTATLSMVKMDGDNYDVVIKDNYLQLGLNNNKASIMEIITGKSVFNAQILWNRVYRLNTDTATGAILVTTDQADNSGIIANNYAQHADSGSELLVTASSGFGVFENKASGVAGASGYLLPATDS